MPEQQLEQIELKVRQLIAILEDLKETNAALISENKLLKAEILLFREQKRQGIEAFNTSKRANLPQREVFSETN